MAKICRRFERLHQYRLVQSHPKKKKKVVRVCSGSGTTICSRGSGDICSSNNGGVNDVEGRVRGDGTAGVDKVVVAVVGGIRTSNSSRGKLFSDGSAAVIMLVDVVEIVKDMEEVAAAAAAADVTGEEVVEREAVEVVHM